MYRKDISSITLSLVQILSLLTLLVMQWQDAHDHHIIHSISMEMLDSERHIFSSELPILSDQNKKIFESYIQLRTSSSQIMWLVSRHDRLINSVKDIDRSMYWYSMMSNFLLGKNKPKKNSIIYLIFSTKQVSRLSYHEIALLVNSLNLKQDSKVALSGELLLMSVNLTMRLVLLS